MRRWFSTSTGLERSIFPVSWARALLFRRWIECPWCHGLNCSDHVGIQLQRVVFDELSTRPRRYLSFDSDRNRSRSKSMRLVVHDAKKGRKVWSMVPIDADSQLAQNEANRDSAKQCALSECQSKGFIKIRSSAHHFSISSVGLGSVPQCTIIIASGAVNLLVLVQVWNGTTRIGRNTPIRCTDRRIERSELS